MYPLLCVSSCLAALFIVLVVSSAFRDLTFFALVRCLTREKLTHFPNALFAMRMLPFALAAFFATGLALPSFLMLEPHNTGEPMSPRLLVIAGLATVLCALMVVRFVRVLVSTRKTTRAWMCSATRLHGLQASTRAYAVDGPPGLFAVTGIVRPTIFISREVLRALSLQELRASLQHEVAHIRSWDNLRRLLVRIAPAPYPGKAQDLLENLWNISAELSADEAALSSGVPALDLASALVRVARFNPSHAVPLNLAASHLIPEASQSAMVLRISNLSEEIRRPGSRRHQGLRPLIPLWPATVLAVVLGYATCLHWLLPAAHKMIEAIVR